MSAKTPTIESVPQHLDEFDEQESLRRMRAFLTQSNDLERMRTNRPVLPDKLKDKLKDWVIIRLGTMTDLKRKDVILQQRALLEMQGWKHIPGCRHTAFPMDAEHGVYMGIGPTAYGELQALRRKVELEHRAATKRRREKELSEFLRSGPGPEVHLEDIVHERSQESVSVRSDGAIKRR